MKNELKSELNDMLFSKFNNIVDKYYHTPRLLYHYTDVNGLVGIIETKNIWATDCRFFNDTSEIDYGIQLVREVITDEMRQENSEQDLEFLERSRNLEEVLFQLFDIYIVCFCEDGDILSQWRGYGDLGDGYSIGVESEKIKCDKYRVGRVIYSREEQESIIKGILSEHLRLLKDYYGEHEKAVVDLVITDLSINFSVLVAQVISLFKHPAFCEEKEWRLVYFLKKFDALRNGAVITNYLDTVRFRSKNEYLVPYIEIGLCKDDKCNAAPIKEITCGPSKQPILKKIALEQFMKKNKYSDVIIINSDIPYRC